MRINKVCSSICSFGNNEAQLQIPDSSALWGRNFFQDSELSNDLYLGSFAPLSSIEIPQTLSYLRLPDLFATASSMHEDTPQQMLPDMMRLTVPSTEAAMQQVRKRKITSDEKSQTTNRAEGKQSKKKKAICTREDPRPCQLNEEIRPETPEKRAPGKRSQKIGDKITALQKLVSPFGKTNTASVLHEASVYIKYLQEQIEVLSIPYFSMRTLHTQGVGGSNRDLRSRGLCLVPVSFTQNLASKDRTDQFTSSTTFSVWKS